MNMRSLAAKLAVYSITILAAIPASAQSFEAWQAKAQKAQKAGDNQVAAEYWTNALRVWEPKDGKARRAKALSERAALYEKAGEPDGALADLTAAIKLDKKNPTLFDRRGQLYLGADKLNEAISDFYSATKLSVTYGPAFYHRGLVYEKQGDAAFAKEDFHTACGLGVKEACAKAKKAKPAKKKAKAAPVVDQAPESDEPAASTAPAAAPKAAAAKPAKAAKAAKKTRQPPADFKPSMAACAAKIQACSDQGKAISVCVHEVKTCEDHPAKGCCPQMCVHEFDMRSNDEETTDAENFRAVFTSGAGCAKEPAP